jgi:hypothetical protein
MEKHIKENAGLEAISCKSFKKYLKSMIKGKQAYLEKQFNTIILNKDSVDIKLDIYINILDTYKCFKDDKEAFYYETTYMKSFKKYLKHMISVKGEGVDRCIHNSTTDTTKKRFIIEYTTYRDVLDAYLYFQALKKDRKGSKCRI